jgi:hypothetical protein
MDIDANRNLIAVAARDTSQGGSDQITVGVDVHVRPA